MANEKTWHYMQNINVDGADDVETAKTWMFQFYTFLSGGADDTLHAGAWEILSGSDGTTVGNSNCWTSTGSVTFNTAGNPHSWFVARSSTILPLTGAGGARYLYLTVDCDGNGNDEKCYFAFDYERPSLDSTNLNMPAKSGVGEAYEKADFQYRYSFDAGVGRTSYFHGIMNETGSFMIQSARSNPGYTNYPFSLAAMRLETPRSPDVDPFPIWLRCAYNTSEVHHGCWSYEYLGHESQCFWNYSGGGNAMWWKDGSKNTQGLYSAVMAAATQITNAGMVNLGWSDQNTHEHSWDLSGDDLDGSWPLLPIWIRNGASYSDTEAGVYRSLRGRVPDLRIGPGKYGAAYDPSGFVIPIPPDSVTGCQVGCLMFPATEAWLPGT